MHELHFLQWKMCLINKFYRIISCLQLEKQKKKPENGSFLSKSEIWMTARALPTDWIYDFEFQFYMASPLRSENVK